MQSESIKELATALSKAQAEMHGAKKNSQNPHFRSTFANLEAVWDAAREPLTKNGLSVVQTLDYREGGTFLVTTLLHSSGEWISGARPLHAKAQDPQGVGSAITYARRYDLMAMVGIAPEDDDAEAAMNRGHQPQAARQTPPPAPKAAPVKSNTPAPFSGNPYDYVVPFGKKYKGQRLGEIPLEDAVNYAEWLEKQANQKGEKLEGQAKEFYDMVAEMVRMGESPSDTGFAPLPADENIPF